MLTSCHICFLTLSQETMVWEHAAMDQSLVQMASSAMTNAIELSKIVIENRVRNTESMVDEDIYKIYK